MRYKTGGSKWSWREGFRVIPWMTGIRWSIRHSIEELLVYDNGIMVLRCFEEGYIGSFKWKGRPLDMEMVLMLC
jgi:hypothetical protein